MPSASQLAEHAEEARNLAWSEVRGRLVEDQEVDAAHQRLQDLDALAAAERQVADPRVGIEIEAEAGAGLPHRGRDRAALQPAPGRVPAQHDILGHRHGLDQHEMLVDHADPGLEGRPRIVVGELPALVDDDARVGPHHAEQHLHEGALARAVLSEQADDLAGLDVEIDAGIGPHRPIAFGDAAHLENAGGPHGGAGLVHGAAIGRPWRRPASARP